MISQLPAHGPPPLLASQQDDEGAEIRKWFGVMTQGWIVLALGAMLGAAIGLLATLRTPPLYEAIATVFLNPPPEGIDLFTTAGMRTIFSSPAVPAEVVKELGLDRPPHSFTPGTFQTRAMTIEDVPNSYLARVKVRLPDPQLAATAATRAGERLSDLTSRVWSDWVSAERTQLERQAEAARQALIKAEKDWLAAQLATSGTRVRVDVPRRVPESHEVVVTEGKLPPATLTSRPTSNGPPLEARLAESRARAAGLADAQKRQGAGSGALGDAYAKEFELVRLENAVELRRRLYMDLGERAEKAGAELASNPRPLRVLEAAAVPNAPMPGTRKRTVALGLLSGLVIAGCLVVAREWRR
jgi:uncharacterized protein involved in exopolysaccharide biosynthesis